MGKGLLPLGKTVEEATKPYTFHYKANKPEKDKLFFLGLSKVGFVLVEIINYSNVKRTIQNFVNNASRIYRFSNT